MTALTHLNPTDTEQATADLIRPHLPRLQDLALRLIVHAGTRGLTDAELAHESGFYLYTMAPRRVELRDQGLVKDSGVRRPTGRAARIVWVATERGRQVAA